MRDHCRARLHQLAQSQLYSIKLEICAAGLEDCIIAEAMGAQRVELNSALALGGLTPSIGLLSEAKKQTNLRIIIMIRPRDGGFDYSDIELETMEKDIDLALKYKADGCAFGVLNPDRTVNIKACKRLIKRMKGQPTVFHRAFDLVPDPFEAMETLIDLGVRRILTSGQQACAIDGATLIRRLIDTARGRIEILPGAGITADNVKALIEQTGASQIHASLSGMKIDNTLAADGKLKFRSIPGPENEIKITQASRIQNIRTVLDTLS
ncbi:copper homeostasis protein CutC [bacterium]|nr:copper homeostasis protein CutC [bacterium]